MSEAARWPGGARAAISLTFDNLGEAAELELGLREAGDGSELGDHHSVHVSLPMVLEELSTAGLNATFFVEGINAELYPGPLARIAELGHEVAFHAWRHEEWAGLAEAGDGGEAANLDRGVAALDAIDLRPRGFRPPGGRIGARTPALLRERGFTYCSPAGSGAALGEADGVAMLPFAWPDCDVFHVLPSFAGLRKHKTGSEEPGGVEAAHTAMLDAVDRVIADGGHLTLVFHTWMIEAERPQVASVLARVRAAAGAREAWVARCDEAADWIAAHPQSFPAQAELDPVSWADPDAG